MTEPLIERRFAFSPDVEIREDGGHILFRGHASVFNDVTDIGPFREQVLAGAFKKTAKEADVRFLYNHDPDSVMARTVNGTLRLTEDRVGLMTEADLDPEDQDVRRLIPKLRSGNVSQMSFGFLTIKDEWDLEPEDGGSPIRSLAEVRLFDVSSVTFPAYENTEGALVNMARTALAVAERTGISIPDTLGTADLAADYFRGAVAHDLRQRVEDEALVLDDERSIESTGTDEPPSTDEPSRDEHSLSDAMALRKKRLEYLQKTL